MTGTDTDPVTEALPETEDDLGGPETFTTIYERIYAKLDRLIGEWPPTGEVLRLTAPGLMDLLVEVLRRSGGSLRVSLAHYYEVGGDLVPDPDMELKVMPKTKMAEALSYRDAFVHREAYPGGPPVAGVGRRRERGISRRRKAETPQANRDSSRGSNEATAGKTRSEPASSPVTDPRPGKVNVAVKADLNAFLDQWLSNLLDQGHQR